MRLLPLLTGLAPLLSTANAARKQTDAFPSMHASAQKANSALKLDEKTFATLTDTPRNHSAAVLFTALEARFGCGVCQTFQPEWETLARSWMRGDKKGESRVVFATIDFVDGRRAFESVRYTCHPSSSAAGYPLTRHSSASPPRPCSPSTSPPPGPMRSPTRVR